MRTISVLRFCSPVVLSVLVAATAVAQDPYGRSTQRILQTEALSHLEKDVRREKAGIDDLEPEARARRALAMVELTPGEDGKVNVLAKVRRGGEIEVAMKGARFDLGEAVDDHGWTVRTGTFEPPRKLKQLRIVVTPPDQKEHKVVCQETGRILEGERVVFCAIPLVASGELYCPAPDVMPVESG